MLLLRYNSTNGAAVLSFIVTASQVINVHVFAPPPRSPQPHSTPPRRQTNFISFLSQVPFLSLTLARATIIIPHAARTSSYHSHNLNTTRIIFHKVCIRQVRAWRSDGKLILLSEGKGLITEDFRNAFPTTRGGNESVQQIHDPYVFVVDGLLVCWRKNKETSLLGIRIITPLIWLMGEILLC